MIHHATYTTDEIFTLMDEASGNKFSLPNGQELSKTNARYRLFFTVGADCVTCGAQGAFFMLESSGDETPHLNLYAVTNKGEVRLMTKDHIIPKAKGGANTHENYQPMCELCNGRKADKLPA